MYWRILGSFFSAIIVVMSIVRHIKVISVQFSGLVFQQREDG